MHELIIEPGARQRRYWQDLFKYRELFLTLAWRDISVRYRQTFVGFAWAVLHPLLTMVIMTVVFNKIAKLSSEGDTPYPLLVIAGMLPWQFFASAFSGSSQSVVANAGLISKTFFPRMIIPAAAVVTSLVDLLIAFSIVFGLMVWFRYVPGPQIAALPLFVLLAFLLSVGLGLLFAALNVKYRDFRYLITFILQFGLYISPVGYSSSVVHDRLGDALFTVYCLNPMVGIIDGFRWALLGGQSIAWNVVVSACAVTLTTLLVGIWYFRRTEHRFADII